MSTNITEEYWSRFADSYDEKQIYVAQNDLLKVITQELKKLPDLGDLVEMGCGTGYFTEAIAAKSKRMVATDLSDTLLETANKRMNGYLQVTVRKENCMATSFSSEAYDAVFTANLIHVIESPLALLEECHRILRRNGRLIITTYTSYGMTPWEKVKMGIRFIKAWGRPPAHTHSFSPDDLVRLMKDTGFAVDSVKVIGEKTKALFAIGRKVNGSTMKVNIHQY